MSSERILVSPTGLLSTEFGSCTIFHRKLITESAANRRWVFTLICLENKACFITRKISLSGMIRTLTDEKCRTRLSYEHGTDFERLRSYDRLKFGMEGYDY
jgi:hypothetical protein